MEVVYKNPYLLLEQSGQHDDFKFSGVYFYLTMNEQTETQIVCVGQVGPGKTINGFSNVCLKHHNHRDKNYW